MLQSRERIQPTSIRSPLEIRRVKKQYILSDAQRPSSARLQSSHMYQKVFQLLALGADGSFLEERMAHPRSTKIRLMGGVRAASTLTDGRPSAWG